MPLPDATKKLIQQGAFCNVMIYDETNTRQTLGLVQNASYNEDFNVVAAQVIGFFGPVSLDSGPRHPKRLNDTTGSCHHRR